MVCPNNFFYGLENAAVKFPGVVLFLFSYVSRVLCRRDGDIVVKDDVVP